MIKGIDAQIMIQRTAEYAKEMSQNTHSAEQAREFASRLEKTRTQQRLKTVNKPNEAEGGKVTRDSKQNSHPGASWEDEEEQGAQNEGMSELEEMSRLSVGFIRHKLDIEV